jgi:hypothetical protein
LFSSLWGRIVLLIVRIAAHGGPWEPCQWPIVVQLCTCPFPREVSCNFAVRKIATSRIGIHDLQISIRDASTHGREVLANDCSKLH